MSKHYSTARTGRLSFDEEDKRGIKRVEKGRNKVDKHKKRIYTMAESLNPDDEAFDEYLDHAEVSYQRFKKSK
jgi:hypothetical protein